MGFSWYYGNTHNIIPHVLSLHPPLFIEFLCKIKSGKNLQGAAFICVE